MLAKPPPNHMPERRIKEWQHHKNQAINAAKKTWLAGRWIRGARSCRFRKVTHRSFSRWTATRVKGKWVPHSLTSPERSCSSTVKEGISVGMISVGMSLLHSFHETASLQPVVFQGIVYYTSHDKVLLHHALQERSFEIDDSLIRPHSGWN